MGVALEDAQEGGDDAARELVASEAAQREWLLARVLISTASHLQPFDWLAESLKSPKAVSDHFGSRAQDWGIFLNALAAMGILGKRATSYQNSLFAFTFLCSANGDFFRRPLVHTPRALLFAGTSAELAASGRLR